MSEIDEHRTLEEGLESGDDLDKSKAVVTEREIIDDKSNYQNISNYLRKVIYFM